MSLDSWAEGDIRWLDDQVENDRTLYVNRPVLNADQIITWAKAQGFNATLPAEELHVTIAFSNLPLDWSLVTGRHNELRIAPDSAGRSLEVFNDSAWVLRFTTPALEQDWKRFIDAGASWDWPDYKPHITISFDGPTDLTDIEPYNGPIILGAEVFAEVKEDWKDSIVEKGFNPDEPRDERGRWTGGGAASGSDVATEHKDLREANGIKLSEDQESTLGDYTHNSAELNQALRSGEDVSEDLKVLDPIFKKASLKEPMTVWRFVSQDAADQLAKQDGQTVTDKAYVSTTSDVKSLASYGQGPNWARDKVLVKVELGKGAPALPIADLSDHSHEAEVVVNRGQKFKVSKDGGKLTLSWVKAKAMKKSAGRFTWGKDDLDTEGEIEKVGARHSKADTAMLQQMYDHAVSLGATCPCKHQVIDQDFKIAKVDDEMQIAKVDEDQRLVWGWGSVASVDGVPVVDLQDDTVDPTTLTKAATEFMLEVRKALEMHDGSQIGVVLHSLPLTSELAKTLGITCRNEGWIVGVKISDDAVWKRVKSGELRAFSIGGSANRELM